MKQTTPPHTMRLIAKQWRDSCTVLFASALVACFTGCAASPGLGRYKVFEAFGVPYYYAPREVFTRNSALSAKEGAGAIGRSLLGGDEDNNR